jgi:hypothetical protein
MAKVPPDMTTSPRSTHEHVALMSPPVELYHPSRVWSSQRNAVILRVPDRRQLLAADHELCLP